MRFKTTFQLFGLTILKAHQEFLTGAPPRHQGTMVKLGSKTVYRRFYQ